MPLDLAAVRRYARQIALPFVGASGQERILAAEVAVVGQTAELYLKAAGVGCVRRIAAENTGRPELQVLAGALAATEQLWAILEDRPPRSFSVVDGEAVIE